MEPKENDQKEKPRVSKEYRIANLIVTSVIAVFVLLFAAYLFKIGQTGIGGTIAGMVVAHYFSRMANVDAAGQIESVIARIPETWGGVAESEAKINEIRKNIGGK